MLGRVFLVMFGEDPTCRACDLRGLGWFVDAEYEDGGQAFRIIKVEPPDVVVIDLTRRPSHGQEVARALRETATTRHLPLVAVDGDDDARQQFSAIAPDVTFTTWEGLPAALDAVVRGD